MPGFTDRRAVRAAAVALPAATVLSLLTGAAVQSAASASATTPTAPTGSASSVPTVDLKPSFTSLPTKKLAAAGTGRAQARAAATTPKLQTFTRTFRYASQHKTYSYTMVGYDPNVTGTAKIPNSLTPVRFRFSNRAVVVPNSAVTRSVTRSGLYAPLAFPGGKGQYGDVFMRTQFWSNIRYGKRAWHVTLRAPKVNAPLKLTVPSSKGGVAKTRAGAVVYLVDINWFDGQIQNAIAKGSPAELTQFLGSDVVLCGRYSPSDFSSCGIGGYHSATDSADGLRTYSYQSFLNSKIFGATSGFYGLAPMTHELAEWLADPYVDNVVPKWTEPSNPQYGCSDALEVGDPLVGKVLVVAKQPYQDEAYLSFFARQKPSIAWLGRYSWFNNFKTYSKGC